MKIEDIKSLLEEIGLDKDGNGYIDCGTGTEFMDCSRYRRIIAAIKQNVELQNKNEELTKKLEEVEKQGMESLLTIEKIKQIHEEQVNIANRLIEGVSEYIKVVHLKDGKTIRIGDYIFRSDGSYYYDSIKEVEPIELKLKITENSDKETKCPICNKPLGKYPAISREDNKTKICSNCGTLEALAAFKESQKGEKANEQDI